MDPAFCFCNSGAQCVCKSESSQKHLVYSYGAFQISYLRKISRRKILLFYKAKHVLKLKPKTYILEYSLKRNENLYLLKSLYTKVHSRFIYNS